METNNQNIMVWDLALRCFHWLLVAAFFTAWWKQRSAKSHTMIFCSLVFGLLLFRFIWGFVGHKHARFSGFWPSVEAIRGHFRLLLQFKAAQDVGHTPMGSVMIFILLLMLLILTLSGMVLAGVQMNTCLFSFASASMGFETEIYTQQIHDLTMHILLVLIGIHLAGVAVESILLRSNLVVAMFTGKKKIKEMTQ